MLRRLNWFDSLIEIEKSRRCTFTVVLTRHCNLRCSHCNVHEWLDTKTEGFYPLSKLNSFIEKLREAGKSEFYFQLIGGEVLSKYDRLSSFISEFKDYWISMTTNLVNLPEEHDILKNVRISVSVDGLPEDHDRIRGQGTFKKTFKNIDRMTKEGHELQIQASLDYSYFKDKDKLAKFIGLMKYVGVKEEDVSAGLIVPERSCLGVDDMFIEGLSKNAPYKVPCCSYRFMSNFVVTPDGKLWNGYYNVGKHEDCLGTLDDDLNVMREKYKDCILRSHFGKDENCTTCPAIKYCWGLYCHNTFKYNDLKPSSLCNKEKIIEETSKIDVEKQRDEIKNTHIKEIYELIHGLK